MNIQKVKFLFYSILCIHTLESLDSHCMRVYTPVYPKTKDSIAGGIFPYNVGSIVSTTDTEFLTWVNDCSRNARRTPGFGMFFENLRWILWKIASAWQITCTTSFKVQFTYLFWVYLWLCRVTNNAKRSASKVETWCR